MFLLIYLIFPKVRTIQPESSYGNLMLFPGRPFFISRSGHVMGMHLAIGLGVTAIEQKIPVLFINASVLIEQLKDAYHTDQLDRYLKKLTRPRVLIIDEIAYLPFDEHTAYCFSS